MSSRKYLLVAVLVVVGMSSAIGVLLKRGADQERKIQSLEQSLRQLQSSPIRIPVREQSGEASARAEKGYAGTVADRKGSGTLAPANAVGSLQILKDLETVSDSDPRSYLEKLQELLSGSPSEEKAAIASRFIFDKAHDSQALPDYALQSLYASQSNPDLKRVIAQVLAQRGNNALLNSQIAESQARLTSNQPRERRDALAQLAKMHSTKAVDAIAPLLQDPDTTVRLEALFALRDTGNQQHVSLVEPLVNDPDPSVSTLAADVLSSLKNMSSSARTSYARSDIEAELPPIANP